MAYSTNTATDAVRLWVASPTKVVTSKPYDAGMLYVTEMTNEDNRVTIEYKDMQDRVVRQRQLRTTGQYADTDYCYDDFGRLAFVIPPAVTKSADLTIDTVKSDPWFSKYVYAYLYDARGRVVEKHIPGAGWTSIVYNKLDLPIATQDAAQRGNNEWTFTKYDAYGRVAVTGVYTNKTNITLASVQALADGASYSQWETRTSGKNYDNAAFPDTTTSTGSIFSTIHAVNYYDSYSFTSKSFAGASKQVHGLATGSKTRVLGTETWLYTVIFYDDRGRVKHTWTEQLSQSGKVADETTYEYDFVGKITRSERKISNIQQ